MGALFPRGSGKRTPSWLPPSGITQAFGLRAPVFLLSRERCAFVRMKYTSQWVFFSFLYNNYITYAFIHYELISASQRYTTKETINDIMWP